MSKRLVFAFVAALVLVQPLHADFRDVAHALDRRLGSRTWIPFLGLGRVFVQATGINGIHDFQLAVYEGHRLAGVRELDELMRTGVGIGFTPLVRVRERNGQATFVYARPIGKTDRLELMILTHDREDTVLVRVDVNADTFAREFGKHPRRMGEIASR